MELTAEELRVLACLVEKSFTTPDQYPLTTNSLTTACNQKTSRDPVVDYPSRLVDDTMQLLRDAGWARTVRASGSRSAKHKHVVGDRLGVTDAELSVLAVLGLRGPQSVGELTTRTDRYQTFTDSAQIEHVLTALAGRERPLVANVGRRSGQSQDRWVQLLGEQPDVYASSDAASDADTRSDADTHSGATGSNHAEFHQVAPTLHERVADLEARLARLEAALGVGGDD